jgi:UDP-glucose 6-dehydrogenase
MHHKETVGVVGLGVVGEALCAQCLRRKHEVSIYDVCASVRNSMHIKHKAQPHTTVDSLVRLASVLLVALPTEGNTSQDSLDHGEPYDLTAFHALLETVATVTTETSNQPLVFIYSTLTPRTLDTFKQRWPTLHLFHVPEFLSSATAMLDTFQPTRKTVLMGVPDHTPASVTDRARVVLGSLVHESQEVTVVRSVETEATKLFCNAFYATKVQLCNEFYALCQKHHIAYGTVRHLMLQQGWMHPMHTQVPGPNGERGFGGKCLPKDLEALCRWSELASTGKGETDATDACEPCEVLQAVRSEHQRQIQHTTQNENTTDPSYE